MRDCMTAIISDTKGILKTMEWTGLNELREKYLSFFEGKGHTRMDSASLIPKGDNSLLLINSGMAPLKKFFLGHPINNPPTLYVLLLFSSVNS